MKASLKVSFRLFKKYITRLLTIIAIVIVSVGFMSGLGEVKNKIDIAQNNFYISENISDLYLKSKRQYGFSLNEIRYLNNKFGENNVLKSFSYELKNNNEITRVYSFNIVDAKINKLKLLEGEFPKTENEVVVERKTNTIKSYNIGDVININNINYFVCGIVINPLILIEAEEPSLQFENEHLSNVVYLNSTQFITNDVYITLENRELFKSFNKKYKAEVEKLKQETQQVIGEDNVVILSLYENVGLYSMHSYAEKVGLITIIFVIFFLLVTLLVVYSTMSRLLDEERSQIACLKTMGFSDYGIVNKYVMFVLIATIIGGLLAFGVGYGLTSIIYSAFNMQYIMPPLPKTINFTYYALTFGIITLSTVLLTVATGISMVKNKPITLLTPKAPKSGKKVFIEKISFIWNKLSFKYKSTLRNVFLFKSRFFMTVISIIGSTVLVLAGMGLLDCAIKLGDSDSIVTISCALIVFSAVLCLLVIYNITNINVSERNREIATLMVLGYTNKEVTNYIFREIYIMSFIGAILGVPLGLGFIYFVFDLISFGAIQDINWYTWVLAPLVTMFFSFLSTMFLYKKIVKTDMNSSLKILE